MPPIHNLASDRYQTITSLEAYPGFNYKVTPVIHQSMELDNYQCAFIYLIFDSLLQYAISQISCK